MTISLTMPKSVELKPRIVVIGVGGAGGNAVNNMIGSGLDGVEFVVANTDAQALSLSKADRRVQMGGAVTQGLGAGMRPEVGEEAAENSLPEILEHLEGAHMLFVAAGMGGGTGTGAAHIIARAARERGILTVGIVTKPFQFEGSKRMKLAEEGIEKLYASVDTLLIIPNQNLFRVATESTTMSDAFGMADEVLNSGVRGITDLMVVPGIINLDFADVRTVMFEMGKAMMGTGEATGERRAIEAAESAISNPLLDDVSLKGAKGVLINITGGSDLTLYEVDEAASLVRGQVDPDANIIVGSALDPDLEGLIRVSVVATGVESEDAYIPVRKTETATRPTLVAGVDTQAETLSDAFAAEPAETPAEPVKPVAAEAVQDTSWEKLEPVAAEAPAPEPMPAPTPARAPAPSYESAPYNYRKPVAEPAAPAAPKYEDETQTVVKRPFGFFGRKKAAIPPRPLQTPVPARSSGLPHGQPRNGDLFGADSDDELEIPSFLRRQNK